MIIEAKASGTPLTQELRAMGIPVMNFSPGKGQDKYARVNAVAPLFESGMIWAPDKSFAEEIIEECAQFPNGEHDDLVDSMTQAVLRFRQGGFIGHPEDYAEEESGYRRRWRTKMVKWIKDRICEPSSYAAVGVGVMGVGMIIGQPILIWVGIAGGAAGFILKEKGVL